MSAVKNINPFDAMLDMFGEDAVAEAVGTYLGRRYKERAKLLQDKHTPARDPAYLRFIREMDCVDCGHPGPNDPDHQGRHGIATKADDYRTLPRCRKCHRARHDGRPAAFPVRDKLATTEQQLDHLITYMRTLRPPKGRP